MSNIVEHRKFVCVEFGETNNNKFWQYTIYDDGTALVEWGRIGVTCTPMKTTKEKALSKMREKTNPNNPPDKKYTEVKTVGTSSDIKVSGVVSNSNLKDIAKKQIRAKNATVQKLIDFLIKVNAHNIYEASGGKIQYDESSATFKTPLGVIDIDQVNEARDILNDMASFVAKGKYNDSFEQNLNRYLRLIPHNVGMKKISPERIFPDLTAVQKENDLLDGLETSFIDVTTNKNGNTVKDSNIIEPKIFDVDLDILSDRDKEVERINRYYEKTKKSMHQSFKYKLKSVYKIEIKKEKELFEKHGKPLGNIMELFHGTKCSNCLSILKQGLVIPSASSAHCTGRLFGNGLYASDISSKALNYATGYWGSGGSTARIFMFLLDFAMGKTYKAKGYGDYKTNRDGYDSTFAEGGRYGLQNNEMIVYSVNQANLKYLLEFE